MLNPAPLAMLEIETATIEEARNKRTVLLDATKKNWLLGRSELADIVLQSHNVSAVHARLHYEGGGCFMVEDLDSANGTYMRGSRLPPRTKKLWSYGETIYFSKPKFHKEKATLLQPESDGLDSLLMSSESLSPAPSSWRSRKFSDWTLKLGDETFQVHRTILGEGERHSRYFFAQFDRWEEGSDATTDMRKLLPEPCWFLVEPLLDYIYDGNLLLTVGNVVHFLRMAQILQIDELCKRAITYIRDCIHSEQALQILDSCFQHAPGLEIVIKRCLSVLAKTLDSLSPLSLARFPPGVLLELLNHRERSVSPSHLCRCVTEYLRSYSQNNSDDEVGQLFCELVPLIMSSNFTVCPPDALCLLTFAMTFGQQDCQKKCWQAALDGPSDINLLDLPVHAMVCELLDSDSLSVAAEDQVFDMILKYCNARSSSLSTEQLTNLWATCRFVHLSPECISRAVEVEHIPSEWLKVCLAGRVIRDNRGEVAFQAFISKRECAEGSRAGGSEGNRLKRRRVSFANPVLRDQS